MDNEIDGSELLVTIVAIGLSIYCAWRQRTSSLHPLFITTSATVGLVRISVLLSIAWIAFVIWKYADPSIVGFYVGMYLILGYAIVKTFGLEFVSLFGVRLRVDVYERNNLAAALFVAAFALATGLIFGGSLWGDADPVGDDEGGWWIPMGFFLLGWLSLVLVTLVFIWRERVNYRIKIIQERSFDDAKALSVFLLGSAVMVTDAVAGDFFGWRHGLLSFGVIILMLFAREMLSPRQEEKATSVWTVATHQNDGRVLESIVYLALVVIGWLLSRVVDLQLK